LSIWYRADTIGDVSQDSRTLFDLVESLGRLLRGDLRARGAAGSLQPVHLQALHYLRAANRYSNTPLALAEYLGSTKGTVSQSLLVLHRRGLLERYADERDRRIVHLRLSEQGERLLGRDGLAGAWEGAVADLPEADLAAARRVLQAALLSLQRAGGSRSFGVCRTCTHFSREAGGYRCGLTGESLSEDDSRRICREHDWPR
jgi:DNA-binding MarR family transcriptional regulator